MKGCPGLFKPKFMKSQLSRILMFLSVVCLAGLFVFPMWKITLYAPQYPDGVTLRIHIDRLSGDTPGTLQNVNILNHYVGMKYIEEDAIPELDYFKYIIAGMLALGLLALILNKKPVYYSWAIVMVLLAVVGLYDFYLWEYDYGHNLSPKAPIKIPGASFQPPLFGTKVILNFIAKSFPDVGGYFAGIAIVLAVAAGYTKKRQHHHEKSTHASNGSRRSADRLQYIA